MKYDSGSDSEWNEGNLKSKRLDEIQQLINSLKMNLSGITNGKFNYELLLRAIDDLYGEGNSLYSEDEIKDVDKIRKNSMDCLRFMCPHIMIKVDSIGKSKNSFLLNPKNFDMLTEFLYEYEMKVKKLNNEHGLSTKNKEDDDGL